MTPPCQSPIAFTTLIDYYARELSEVEAAHIEEHYFSCAYCSERLEAVASFDVAISALTRGGHLLASTTLAMVERARSQHVIVREYRTDVGEHVNCTAGPEDQLTVTRYGGLAGITSVDVHFRGTIVGTQQVIEMELVDAPVDQQTGDLVLIAPGALNRSFPPLDIEVRLTAHTAAGSHEAGPYHYHHRPWDTLDDAERERRAGR
jgi:hypothetical protein